MSSKRASQATNSSLSTSDTTMDSDFKDTIKQLQSELDAQKNLVKQIRREKTYELKQLQEQEQHRLSIALKDVRAKLHQDKVKELELQREALNKKYESDAAKVAKLRETEMNKLRSDLKKCQAELEQMTKRGLSASARGTFVKERTRFTRDIHELRGAKKNLEEELTSVRQENREKIKELQETIDVQKTEMNKIIRESEQEVRKLLDEIKVKEKSISVLEKDISAQSGVLSKLQMEKENMKALYELSTKAASWEKRSPGLRKESLSSHESSESVIDRSIDSSTEFEQVDLNQQVTTLTCEVNRLEEQCTTLSREKMEINGKLKEMETQFKPSQEKLKRFFDQNMELTSMNQLLEEKLRSICEENEILKNDLDKSQREVEMLFDQLSSDGSDQASCTSFLEELDELRLVKDEQEKTIDALKMACAEKDRRIELIAYRKRKQRMNKAQQKVVRFLLPAKVNIVSPPSSTNVDPNEKAKEKEAAAGIKETYYGYDEDKASVESEMSAASSSRLSSSRISLDATFEDDDVFDEVAREELERNYQRLVKEHLELEKSFGLLQTQCGSSHVDPQREVKLRTQLEADLLESQCRIEDLERQLHCQGQDIRWLEEKETLTVKIIESEQLINELQDKLQDSSEKSEDLEFRTLELEELNDKLSEEVKETITFLGQPHLTPNGILQMYTRERGNLEISICDLIESLDTLGNRQNRELTSDERVTLIQTHTVLSIADQTLKELREKEEHLKKRVQQLEHEKAELITKSAGESAEVVLEYEHTRQELLSAQQKIGELEKVIEELNQAEAVHKYTDEFNQRTEERYRNEIAALKQKLSGSNEGRDYERDILQGKIEQLKKAEQRILEFEIANQSLKAEVATLQGQINVQHDTSSLTESEQDTSVQLHMLRAQLSRSEQGESDLMEESKKLKEEVARLKERLAEYESGEVRHADRHVALSDDLEATQARCHMLKEELESTREELNALKLNNPPVIWASQLIQTDLEDDVGQKTQQDVINELQKEIISLRQGLKVKDSDDGDVVHVLSEAPLASSVHLKESSTVTAEVKELTPVTAEVTSKRHEDEGSSSEGSYVIITSLEEELAQLRSENDSMRTQLQDKHNDVERLTQKLMDLQNDYTLMESKFVHLKQDNAELKLRLDDVSYANEGERMQELRASEQKHKERIKNLEGAIHILKGKLNEFIERSDKYSRKCDSLRDTRHALRTQCSEKDQTIEELRKRIQELELAEEGALQKLHQLELEKTRLSAQLSELEAVHTNVGELQVIKHELDVLRQTSQESQDQVKQLQELADRESEGHRIHKELAEQLREENKVLVLQVESIQHQLQDGKNSPAGVEAEAKLLEELDHMREELKLTRERETKLNEDKNHCVTELQEQLSKLVHSESKLNESISDLETMEKHLKEQLSHFEGIDPDKIKEYESDLESLRLTNSGLLARIQELEETESDKQSSHEQKEGTKTEDEENTDTESMTRSIEGQPESESRIAELEARVKELQNHESDLMEQLYEMGLEKQELEEHVDELIAAKEKNSVSGDSPKTASDLSVIDEYQKKVADLESDNAALKDQLLKAKLDAVETLKDAEPELMAVQQVTLSAEAPSHKEDESTSDHSEKDKKIQELEEALLTHILTARAKEGEAEKYRKELEIHQSKVKELEVAIESKTVSFKEKEGDVEKYEAEIHEQYKRVKELEDALEAAQMENGDNEQFQTEIKGFQKQIKELEGALETAVNTSKEKDDEFEKCENELQEKHTHIKKLEKTLAEVEHELETERKIVKDKEASLDQYETDVQELTLKLDKLTSSTTDNELVAREKAAHAKQIKALEHVIKVLKDELEIERKEHEEVVAGKFDTIGELNVRVHELEDKEKELTKYVQIVETSKHEMDRLSHEVSEKAAVSNELESKIEQLTNEVAKYKLEHATTDDEITRIESTVTEITPVNVQLVQSASVTESEDGKSESQTEETSVSSKEQDAVIAELQAKLEREYKLTDKRVKDVIDEFTGQVHERDETIRDLTEKLEKQSDYEHQRDRMRQLEHDADQRMMRIKQLESDLEDSKRISSELQHTADLPGNDDEHKSKLELELVACKEDLTKYKTALSESEEKLDEYENQLAKSQSVLAESEEKLDDYEQEISKLKSIHTDDEQKLEDYEHEISRLKSVHVEFEQKLEDYELEITKLKSVSAEDEKKLEEYEHEISKLKSMHTDDQPKSEYEHEIHTLKSVHTEDQQKLESYEHEIAKFKSLHADEEQKLEDYENEISKMKAMHAEYEQKLEEYEHEIGKLKSVHAEGEQKLEDYEHEIGKLKSVHAEGEQKLEDYEHEIGKLKSMLAEDEQKLEDYENELAKCKQLISEHDEKLFDYDTKLTRSENEISENEQKLAEYEELIVKYKAELADKDHKMNEYEDEIASLRSDVGSKELQQTLSKYEDELAKHKQLLGENEQKLDEYEMDITTYKSQIGEHELRMKDVEAEIESLKSDLKAKEITITTLNEQIEADHQDASARLRNISDEFNSELSEKEEQLKSLRDKHEKELGEKDDHIQSLHEKNEAENGKLLQKLHDCAKDIAVKNAEIKSLGVKLNTQAEESDIVIKEKADSIKSLEERLQQQTDTHALQLQESEAELDHCKTAMHDQELELKSLQEELESRKDYKELSDKLLLSEGEIEKYKTELSEKTETIKAMNEKFDTEVKERDNFMRSVSVDFEAQFEESDKKKKQLTDELEDINGQLEEKENKIKLLTNELEEMNEQLEEKEKKIKELTDELDELGEQFEVQEKKMKQLTTELDEMTEQLQFKDGKIAHLDEEMSEIKDAIDSLDSHLKEKDDTIEALDIQLKEKEEEIRAIDEKHEEERHTAEKHIRSLSENLALTSEGGSANIDALEKRICDLVQEHASERDGYEKQLMEFRREIRELNSALRDRERQLRELQHPHRQVYDETEARILKSASIQVLEAVPDQIQMQRAEPMLKTSPPKHDDRPWIESQLKEKEEHIHMLEIEIMDLKEQEKQQNEKMDLLQDSEAKLMEQLEGFAEREEKLREQISSAKSSSHDHEVDGDLQQQMQELQDQKKHLNIQVEELEKRKGNLKEKLDEYQQTENKELHHLREKVDILLDTEEKLIDRLQEQEEVEAKLNDKISELEKKLSETVKSDKHGQDGKSEADQSEEIRKYRQQIEIMKASLEEAEDSIEQLETSVADAHAFAKELQKQIEEKKEVEQDLTRECGNLRGQHSELQTERDTALSVTDQQKTEIMELREKVNEKEQKMSKLQMQLDNYEEELQEINACLTESSEPVKKTVSEQVRATVSSKSSHDARVAELEASEKQLKDRVNELEKSEAVLQAKLDGLEKTLEQMERTQADLREQIGRHQEKAAVYKNKMADMEKQEVALSTRVSSLEAQRDELLSLQKREAKQRDGAVSDQLIQKLESQVLADSAPGSTELSSKPHTYLHEKPKDELVARVLELEHLERFHKAKILELQDNLQSFRQAVEVMTVTMETETDLPAGAYRPKTKDSEYEAKVMEMVKSEVALKVKVMEGEKREDDLRAKLEDVQVQLKDLETDFKEEIEDLEEEIDKLRKNETRLKNQLEHYSGKSTEESELLDKIQKLEGQLVDLEASERKNKRQVDELQEVEKQLRNKLEVLQEEQDREKQEHEDIEKEKYHEVLSKLKLLEISDRDLQDTINQLGQDDLQGLVGRIGELERSEKALKRKVEILQAQEPSFGESAGSMLDTPEAILRQQIRDLEKIERHLKQQVVELEGDREELHEITRKDKNAIHDLNVRIRELQLSESSLKDQVNRYEVTESHLTLKVDSLNDRITELEAALHKAQVAGKQAKTELQKLQHHESDLNQRLENTVEDFQMTQQKMKRRLSDLELEKRSLMDKLDEASERVSDLESIELSLKQKLKNIENCELNLRSRISELEQAESAASLQVVELETVSDSLSQKLHKLEEEKTSLMYQISDLEIARESITVEKDKMKDTLETIVSKLDKQLGTSSVLEEHVTTLRSRESQLEEEIDSYRKTEEELRQKVAQLDKTNFDLQLRIQEHEAIASDLESRANALSAVENDNSFLNLQVNQLRHDYENLEKLKNELDEKVKAHEASMANHEMSTIASSELAEMNKKIEQLAVTEKKLAEYEKSEKEMLETIRELREGKSQCGHEVEIKDLKTQLNQLSATVQAHELLKGNYEELKSQYTRLQQKIKDGDVTLKEKIRTSGKAVQVSIGGTLTIKEITPELKQALLNLGARHPNAYEEFIHSLQPSTGPMSVPRVRHTTAVTLQKHQEPVIEPTLVAEISAPRQLVQSPHGMQPPSLATVGETDEIEEEPITPVAKKAEKQELAVSPMSEGPLWKTVEAKKGVPEFKIGEESYWANIERTSGDLDEMTLSITFPEEEATDGSNPHSDSEGAPPPPLPVSLPPMSKRDARSPSNDSFYLPSHRGDDDGACSADEASEIVDEEAPKNLRARSVDRAVEITDLAPLGSSPQIRNRKKNSSFTGSLDSIPDSGLSTLHQSHSEILNEKVAELERQVKSKDKELELARINQREMERKLKDSARETMAIANKTADYNHNQNLEQQDIILKKQLEKLEKELRAKTNEVDRLTQEVRTWQEESWTAQEKKKHAEDTLVIVKSELDSLQDTARKALEMQHAHIQLQNEHDELLKQHTTLEKAEQEKATLEKIILKLKGQLNDIERIDLERQHLQDKLTALQDELKLTKKNESELTQENARMRHQLDGLKKENATYRNRDKDYRHVQSKYDEMERTKTEAQTMVAPLRARVIRLGQKCQSKDGLIERLLKEVRHYGQPASLIEEAERVHALSATEEYNRPLSPLPTPKSTENFDECLTGDAQSWSVSPHPSPPLAHPIRPHHQRYSSDPVVAEASPEDQSDASTYNEYLSLKLDLNKVPLEYGSLDRKKKKSSSSTRPRSVDGTGLTIDDFVPYPPQMSRQPVTQLGSSSSTMSSAGVPDTGRSQSVLREFVVIKDYHPGKSLLRKRQLALKEGQIIKVLGVKDERGFYEAKVDGVSGLVPASHLAPATPVLENKPVPPRRSKKKKPLSSHADSSPEMILEMHDQLQSSHVPNHHVSYQSGVTTVNTSTIQRSRLHSSPATLMTSSAPTQSITHQTFHRTPVPPPVCPSPPPTLMTKTPKTTTASHTHRNGIALTHFHGSGGVSLSLPRQTDDDSLFISPADKSQPSRQSVVERSPESPDNFRVQRVIGKHSLLLSWSLPIMDELARSNGTTVKGYKIYIDNQDQQFVPSPYLTKALVDKLNLQRATTFSIQTIGSGGRASGVVDTVFEGLVGDSGNWDREMAGDNEMSSLMSAPHADDGERRLFLAIYDYTPGEQSTNTYPGEELAFQTGDIITTYGIVRPDGFYHAKVHGQKGLVPASFIEEVALLRSHSKRSLSGRSGSSSSKLK